MATTNYRISLEIAKRVNAPHKILGGPHATLKGEDFGKDFLVVKGEAEGIFLEAISRQGKGVINAGITQNLDGLPRIDRSLFCNDPYEIDGKVEATISTARGCPFSCVFCSVPIINGRKMRARSIDNVVEEITELKSQGVNSIHFMDDLFNYSKKRVMGLCDRLIEEDLNVSWRDLSRVELLDEEMLERMKESGCYKLAFGIESGIPRILDYIGKCKDLEHIKGVFKKCRDLGIDTKAFFTIGYPTETEDEIKRTLEFSRELGATEAYFMVVRAFPGTRLYDEMREVYTEEELDNYEQFQDEDGYVKYHVMNFSSLNGMSNEKLDGFVKEGYKKFYNSKECVRN